MKQYLGQAALALAPPHNQKNLNLPALFAHRPCRDEKPAFGLDNGRKLKICADWPNHPESERPRRRFKIALTDCGLALPWVAFITCPTNHDAIFGFALASAAFSGLAVITCSTARSIAASSVTCVMPWASTIF